MPAPWSDWVKELNQKTAAALYQVVVGEHNQATVKRLSVMLGRPETTIRDYFNPEKGLTPPHCLIHAVWLLTFHPDLEEVLVGPGRMVIERPTARAGDHLSVHKELTDLQIALGQTLDAWSQDMADGRLDLVSIHQTNCDGLVKEMMELIHALTHPSHRKGKGGSHGRSSDDVP